jgi:glucose/arabinose dehydrogenase
MDIKRSGQYALVILFFCFGTAVCQPYALHNGYPELQTFNNPVCLESFPDSSNNFLVAEKAGRLWIVNNTAPVREKKLFLDISDHVQIAAEAGLLGCAIHPHFAKNHFIYLYYVDTLADTIRTFLSRFTATGNNYDTIERSSELDILVVKQSAYSHNGGGLSFGPDGYLYLGLGDGGAGGGDPHGNAQNKDSLLGKIIRLDVDNPAEGKNYGIPVTNPYVMDTSGYRKEIYARGFRNPWRFSFDDKTGKLWCGDVGQDTWEEVDIVRPGRNYGWGRMEGTHCFPPENEACDKDGLTLPVWEFKHEDGRVAVMGGYVYYGHSLPELRGQYIYGDLNTATIWALSTDTPYVNQELLIGGEFIYISSFGITPDGELAVLGYGNGQIMRIANMNSVRSLEKKEFQIHLTTTIIEAPLTSLSLTIDNPASSTVDISLLTDIGQRLLDVAQHITAQSTSTNVDLKPVLKQLCPGIYFIRATDGVSVVSKKVIVQ